MSYFNLPNSICYLRVLLCLVSFWLFSENQNEIAFLVLTLIVMLMDALDGFIARRFNMCTEFGAKLDIVSDRLIELAYWLYFALIYRLSIWVFVIFLVRGLIVDYVSFKASSPLGSSWLRSSRVMRFLMGFAKILSFAMLIIAHQYWLTIYVVIAAVILNLLRAVPVFYSIINSDGN